MKIFPISCRKPESRRRSGVCASLRIEAGAKGEPPVPVPAAGFAEAARYLHNPLPVFRKAEGRVTDTPQLIRTLEDSGLERRAADAIASALEENRRTSGGVPPWAPILAAGLVAGAIGFLATIAIENREGVARVEETQRELVRRVGLLEEGQQTLKEGQQALMQRVQAIEEGQREILRLLRQR